MFEIRGWVECEHPERPLHIQGLACKGPHYLLSFEQAQSVSRDPKVTTVSELKEAFA